MTSALLMATLTGSTLALVASAHCTVMCGPLAMAVRVRGGSRATASYFAGRLVSYTVLGVLAGSVGHVFLTSSWARWAEAVLSWLLAISLAFAASRVLRQTRSAARPIALGKAPRANRFGRLLARAADDPLLLGAVTALLPCGALFSALTAAAALGSAAEGALAMSAFAVLSGAVVVGVAQLGALETRGPALRRAVGYALLVGAVVMVYRPIGTLRAGASAPTCHQISTTHATSAEH